MRISWSVLFRACPMWREPVIFGGGITMVYGGREEAGSAWKKP
jgi:hypothetical protein